MDVRDEFPYLPSGTLRWRGACRTRATRQREAKANELHEACRTISQISKEFGIGKEIIEKWLKSSPKNK